MSLRLISKRKVVPPYSKLAEVYDHLMRYVNYKQWARYIHTLIKESGEPVTTILDASCGTGNFIFELARMNYILTGFDYSCDMVRIARRKAKARSLDVPLWVGDMQHLALNQKQDAIICLYDSINYLLTIERWKAFYRECYNNLKVNGLLIFDVCTEWNSITHFQNYTDRGKAVDFKYTRKSYYQYQECIHHNDFKIKFRDDANVYLEYHRQIIYDINRIFDSIPKEKFKILGSYHELTTAPARNDSDRIHFVLQKKQQ